MSIKVTLNKLERAGPKQEKITIDACNLLEQALNHSTFPQKVQQAEFKASWHQSPERRDIQLTNDEVLKLILSGKEQSSENDYEIDLHIRYKKLRHWYKPWSSTIGSTNLGKFPICTSYYFVNDCIKNADPISLAAHFMHEWLHVAGFYHHGGNDARDDVAYVIGNIVHDILEELTDASDESLMI